MLGRQSGNAEYCLIVCEVKLEFGTKRIRVSCNNFKFPLKIHARSQGQPRVRIGPRKTFFCISDPGLTRVKNLLHS